MTKTKAYAGGLAGAISTLVLYALDTLPLVAALPAEQDAALTLIVTSVIGYGLVYLSPANRPL